MRANLNEHFRIAHTVWQWCGGIFNEKYHWIIYNNGIENEFRMPLHAIDWNGDEHECDALHNQPTMNLTQNDYLDMKHKPLISKRISI